MKKQRIVLLVNNQRGVSAVVIAICLFMLVAFVALALDTIHLVVARNELQNAADAGALAGARFLYLEDGTAIDPLANQKAYEAAIANASDQQAVEVYDHMSNQKDVRRGHWSFTTRTFTPNDSLEPVELWKYSREQLDTMTEFVNAVEVTTHRLNQKITSFFAGIFGWQGFEGAATAVAYIGFSGKNESWSFDQPIAICAQSLVDDPDCYNDPKKECQPKCNMGYMLDSGTDKPWQDATHNTAAWTNFTNDPCSTASASDMNALICNDCDPETGQDCPDVTTIERGTGIGATGGVQQVTFDALRTCWLEGDICPRDADGSCLAINPDGEEFPEKNWSMLLPVVDCPGNNVSNCPPVIGAVEVSVMWMTKAGTPDPSLETPFKMDFYKEASDGVLTADPLLSWEADAAHIPSSNPDLTSLTFQELADQYGFPDKYFYDDAAMCDMNEDGIADLTLAAQYQVIPAPVNPSMTLNSYALQTTVQEGGPIPLMQMKDPGDPAYDPNKVCTPEQWDHMKTHREADAAGMVRWISFANHFKLKNADGKTAPLAKKSIYYFPQCDGAEPKGGPGGENFGVLAKIPVLVD
jgi:hypothetical protein